MYAADACRACTRLLRSLCDLDTVLRLQPRSLTAARLGVGACIWDGALVLAAWAAAQPAGTFAGADHTHQEKHTGCRCQMNQCGACLDYAGFVRVNRPAWSVAGLCGTGPGWAGAQAGLTRCATEHAGPQPTTMGPREAAAGLDAGGRCGKPPLGALRARAYAHASTACPLEGAATRQACGVWSWARVWERPAWRSRHWARA